MSSIKAFFFFLFSCNIQFVLLYNSSLKACWKWNTRYLAPEVNISYRAASRFCRKTFPLHSDWVLLQLELVTERHQRFPVYGWIEYKQMILQAEVI